MFEKEAQTMQTMQNSTVRPKGSHAMNKRTLCIAAGVIGVAMSWYLFRPELIFINRTVNETLPSAVAQQTAATMPTVLLQGHFHGVSHATRGVATIFQLPDGKRVLRFTEFETSNGPDVQVYLVAAADAHDNETVTKASFITLGGLKGNIGDQNYALPADADLGKYRAVTVWCRRFGVNFATAPLSRQQS
jgi:Electron transfer DM13